MKPINELSTKSPSGIFKTKTKKQVKRLAHQLFSLQNLLYASGKHSLLIILQGMDTSGKDGTIRNVFSRINPQGCTVKSFKNPTEEEKSHDFLWRIYANLPGKGMIQVFNRSQYEDVLFPVVHHQMGEAEIQERYRLINDFEDRLKMNNTIVLKFYLHIAEKEQQSRLKARLTEPDKKWKYSSAGKRKVKNWNDYMEAYQHAIDACGKVNPWIIVPADQKWYRNYVVAATIVKTLENLKMEYPR
ncbi:MAG: PPK2 family polyphosphate kinase [Bacteroidota bacterium]